MFAYLFLTHGDFGKTLVETGKFIIKGDFSKQISIFSIDYSMVDEMEKIQNKMDKQIKQYIEQGFFVVIFVDVFGGSPSNIAFQFSKTENVDIISGTNLPLVLYALNHINKDESLEKFVSGAIKTGKESIIGVKDLLNMKKEA
jgi:PTS system mannose-specific IIA component